MLRRTSASLVVLALTAGATAAAAAEEDSYYPSKGDPGIDVRSYDLALSWKPPTRTLVGTASLRVAALQDATSMPLDLHPALTVRSVKVDGVDVGFGHRGKNLTVRTAMVAGTSHDVVVRYAGKPTTVNAPTSRTDATGLGWHTNAAGQAWTMQKPYGAYTWYPVNDAPSDKARYTVSLNVPAGWVGVSNGALVSRTTSNGRTRTRFTNTDPIASHLLTVAIGPYMRRTQTGPHGLPLTYWVPKGATGLLKPLLRTPEAISWLEKRLGPFPFDRAGVVVTPGRSSVETQTLITLARDNYRYGDADVREQVAHNLVHQWYGASVTPADWRDLWMSEGMATYLQARFAVSRGWDTWPFWRRELTRNDQFWRDLYGPPGDWFANEFGQRNVHYGSALMLDRLRARIGGRQLAGVMMDWPQQNRNSVRTRAAFISFVEQRAGDLGDFWSTWLNGKDSPA